MCQLSTHIVFDKGDKDFYEAVYDANQDMDYNDFNVEAYINRAANPGPKPGANPVSQPSSNPGPSRGADSGSRANAQRSSIDVSSDDDDLGAPSGAPITSPSVTPGPALPRLDWTSVNDTTRDSPPTTSYGRGAGRSSSAPASAGARGG
jgi:hypothetical protein